MELTDEQRRSIRSKLKLRECPYCKSTRQRRSSFLELKYSEGYKPNTRLSSTAEQVEDVYVIAIECQDCAYMMLFNLKTLLSLKEESSM